MIWFDWLDCTAFQMMPKNKTTRKCRYLKSIISQIRISAGESVGYGRRFVANKPTTIATIPMGMQMESRELGQWCGTCYDQK
jgi:hypothetical protein